MTGLFGGAFDPPHNGHVALAAAAARTFDLEPLVVLVSQAPGHRRIETDPEARLELARLAFPEFDVELDPYPRTIELLEERHFADPLFLVGADEFARFLEIWHRPQEVLERTRLAVATRPGYPQELLDEVLAQLRQPERVLFFEIEPLPVSAHEIRAMVARGEPIEQLVPAAVAAAIARLGLYRSPGYTRRSTSEENRPT